MPDNTSLASLRMDIDAVDAHILSLLNRRASLSLEVGRLKARDADSIFQPQRENEVLDNLLAQNKDNNGPLRPEHIRAIWRKIFLASRALQRVSP